MKHFETHADYVDGCFGCKLTTLGVNTAALKMHNSGADITDGRGTAAYVKDMYAEARAKGEEDPIPANKKAAAFAPAKGVYR